MAQPMSILNQFAEPVDSVPVDDSVVPALPVIDNRHTQMPIFVIAGPSDPAAPVDSSITKLREPLVLGRVTIAPAVVERAAPLLTNS